MGPQRHQHQTMERKKKVSLGSPVYRPVTLTRMPSRVRPPPLLITNLTTDQRLRREKTFVSASTETVEALEALYHDAVDTADQDGLEVISDAESFIHAIKYRVNKNRHNLKFGDPYLGGRPIRGTVTKASYKDVDMYLPLKFKEIRPKTIKTGYSTVHMSRNPSFDRYQSVRSDSNRNLVSPLKLTSAVHEILSHICQSIGMGRVLPLNSGSSDYGEGSGQIVVVLDNVRLTVIPCLSPKVAKRDDDGTIYVTRPYLFDEQPESDLTWRFDNPTRTKWTQDAMNRADRGMRSKALRLAYACQELDSVLKLCPWEFIEMVLYGMFDYDIDQLPDWQAVGLETCFINLLTHWQQHMASNVLIHPLQKTFNVLENMPESNQQQVKNRLTRLLRNRRELIRLLHTSAV